MIINPMVAGGMFQFTFQTQAGVSYVVEYKEDLSDADWLPLEIVEGDGELRDALDAAPESAARFYRVRLLGP